MAEHNDKLTVALAKLEKEKVPEKDLWAGIAHSINDNIPATPVKQRRGVAMPIAASFILIAAVLFVTRMDPLSDPSSQGMHGDALVQAISKQHEEQKLSLLTRFREKAAVTDDWQQQLNELDDAAAAVKRALAEDPDNTALLGMLQHIYQQQLLLIERVHAPKWQQI